MFYNVDMRINHEAFWELIDFGFHRNSEVKLVRVRAIPMMGDPLGSFRKQNRGGVVGPKADNIVIRRSRARDVLGAESGCDNLVSEPIPDRMCADKDVRPLNHEGVVGPKVDNIVIRRSRARDVLGVRVRITRHFVNSLTSEFIGTPKLSEFPKEQSHDG
ncbi:hypothetical protein DVH24_034972 [Malus domestica]|uniref:Uncharacterized protein n=1 Tax=Malus domestica TaxID=3750 RepID=A0A498IJA2_MALDO|nr:hypothetical protein DVH24_034972 [Malus domestica]